jgi:hypothetical protein
MASSTSPTMIRARCRMVYRCSASNICRVRGLRPLSTSTILPSAGPAGHSSLWDRLVHKLIEIPPAWRCLRRGGPHPGNTRRSFRLAGLIACLAAQIPFRVSRPKLDNLSFQQGYPTEALAMMLERVLPASLDNCNSTGSGSKHGLLSSSRFHAWDPSQLFF